MESKNQTNSSSSFTNDLFGSKESSGSSSSGLFNSIFPPPSKTHNNISSQETDKSYDSASGCGSTTRKNYVDSEDKSRNPKTDMSPFYQQEASQPCHLSSSIYYGGQDIYTNPSITNNNPGHSTQCTKDGEDDGLASRGNWWQGSLYY